MDGQVEQLSNAVDVLLLDLFACAYLGELAQRRDESVSNIVDFKMATDPHSMHEALQAEVGDDWILSLVQNDAEYGQVG